jgi:hypothetical protein
MKRRVTLAEILYGAFCLAVLAAIILAWRYIA